MRSVLPELDVSDDVIGKIAFSYSYRSDQLIFPFCKDGAWQNKTAGRPLAHLNTTLCADARIHRSGSELLLERTTTYPAAKLVTAAAGPVESFLPVATA